MSPFCFETSTAIQSLGPIIRHVRFAQLTTYLGLAKGS